jgi:heptosyltransferase-2
VLTTTAAAACQRTVCTINDHRCMRDIAAAEVVAITQRVLAAAGGTP